jgi:hypothetical protein
VKGKQQGTAPRLIWLLGTAAFVAVFAGHVLCLRYLTSAPQKGWADNFVGFSYALSASFAVWATARFVYSRRRAAAVGAFGGVSLVTFLAAAGCFLIGCCGSPMLPIYVSLFGSKAAGIGKPLMAFISLISIGGGYLYVVSRPECNCADSETCPFPEKSSAAGARQNRSTVHTDLDQKETV